MIAALLTYIACIICVRCEELPLWGDCVLICLAAICAVVASVLWRQTVLKIETLEKMIEKMKGGE